MDPLAQFCGIALNLPLLETFFWSWVCAPLVTRITAWSFAFGGLLSLIVVSIGSARHFGNTRKIHLAPISARGSLLEELGAGGVALALRVEIASIREALETLEERPAPYIAPATARDQGYFMVGLRHDGPIQSSPYRQVLQVDQLARIEQELIVSWGGVSIPVGAIVNTLVEVVATFAPFRRRYLRSAIHISMISAASQIESTVQLSSTYAARQKWWKPFFQRGNESVILTSTSSAQDLVGLRSAVRDVAFMVLSIHEGEHKIATWSSMRMLVDGLVALDEYRRTGDPETRDRAKRLFGYAVEIDPENNHHALYYHAVMTMVDRTKQAITQATQYLRLAENTDNLQLKSLVYTGLAYCEAQRIHRLGQRADDTQQAANNYARLADEYWQKYQKDWQEHRKGSDDSTLGQHPLIPYTYSLVRTVAEGANLPREERTQVFREGLEQICAAIALEPENGMFYNNAGWMLLKLLEGGVEDLPSEIPQDLRLPDKSIGPTCEHMLRLAIGFNPKNKLAHSNLCLLYSAEPYRKNSDLVERGIYQVRARFHGLEAVRLDPSYINGYRDLAVVHIRYDDLDEARRFYWKALELAIDPDKDQEIIKDIVGEMERLHKLGDDDLAMWRKPPRELLEPPSDAPATNPTSATTNPTSALA